MDRKQYFVWQPDDCNVPHAFRNSMTKLKLAHVNELELPVNWNDSCCIYFMKNESWYECRMQVLLQHLLAAVTAHFSKWDQTTINHLPAMRSKILPSIAWRTIVTLNKINWKIEFDFLLLYRFSILFANSHYHQIMYYLIVIKLIWSPPMIAVRKW